jgi:hypothetical protein
LRYEYSQWKRDDAASGAGSAGKLSALWLYPKGERGWAVGNDGVVLRYEYSRWKRDDAAFADSGGDKLNSLWLDPNGDRGWDVSGDGEVFRNHRPASRLQKPDEQRLWPRRFISGCVDLDRGALSSGAYLRTTSRFPESDQIEEPPACAGGSSLYSRGQLTC